MWWQIFNFLFQNLTLIEKQNIVTKYSILIYIFSFGEILHKEKMLHGGGHQNIDCHKILSVYFSGHYTYVQQNYV
jgi:hypothetical protein